MGAEIEENINKIIRSINSLGFKHRLTDEQFRHIRKEKLHSR